ncbi:HdeD family acid-resistance protein [Planctomicrobium piriforme]|uniref:Uncharacterized membrane protein HdeD, DUF308 family n=1 Tax=Planctomicrobium piriforme TaxID=1576369 RepID=A0A1I3T1D8_9PLAN|nr:HdeD family acid-resistance protein [Planctomicrobium piriforme]SFJ63357.1 Uncharacterized membrane protein HdeD, DUF308 family [Planctomicrobium piriforme]
MLQAICRRWWLMLLRGLAAIAFGICAIIWPQITLLLLIGIYGGFCIVEGIAEIALGVGGGHNGKVWWSMILMGLLSFGAGLVAIFYPGLTALVLLWVIAFSSILHGVFEIAAAVSLRKVIQDEWILVLSGVLSVGFGAVLLAAPREGALALVLLIGAYMIGMGVLAVALSLRLRHLAQQHVYPQTPAVAP